MVKKTTTQEPEENIEYELYYQIDKVVFMHCTINQVILQTGKPPDPPPNPPGGGNP